MPEQSEYPPPHDVVGKSLSRDHSSSQEHPATAPGDHQDRTTIPDLLPIRRFISRLALRDQSPPPSHTDPPGNPSPPRAPEINVVSSTFPHSDQLSFHTSGLTILSRLSGREHLTVRHASLGKDQLWKINLIEDRPETVVVIDAGKSDMEHDRRYPEKLNSRLKSALAEAVTRSQLEKVTSRKVRDRYSQVEEDSPYFDTEDIARKVFIVVESAAPIVGLVYSLIPDMAPRAIEGLVQMYFGIENFQLGQLPSSLLVLFGMIFTSEAADFMTKKVGMPDYSPVLFHRIAIADLLSKLPFFKAVTGKK